MKKNFGNKKWKFSVPVLMIGAVALTIVVAGCCDKEQNDALTVIANRCSIRNYDQSKEVDDATIEVLLRAAMAAPTAFNLQPWEFIVVRDKNTLKRLSDTDRYSDMTAKASVAIVVCGDTLNEMRGEPNRWWSQDCSAATENLLLAATAKGLGAVWTAVYPHENRVTAVRQILNIPDRFVPLCIVPVGYPADPSAKPKDKWKPAKIHNEQW